MKCSSNTRNNALSYAWYDLVGNIGVALIILSYLLLQIGRLASDGWIYSFMNLLGAVCVLISLLFAFNLSSFVIEIFWIGISLVGLIRWSIRRRQSPER